jgi:hypothetical protein
MTVVLVYDCTVAKRSPLLCSNFTLLSSPMGVPVSPAGTLKFTIDHTLRSGKWGAAIIAAMQEMSDYQVSTKSWPVLSVRSAGTAFKPSAIHLRVSAGSITASISR